MGTGLNLAKKHNEVVGFPEKGAMLNFENNLVKQN